MPSKLPKNIDELIDENFMDKNKFSMTIENIVKDSNKTINYIDAIVDFCESKNIEIECISLDFLEYQKILSKLFLVI